MIIIILTLQLLASGAVIIWFLLIFFRGQFWRADQYLPNIKTPLKKPPEIVIIIPARNEERTIDQCILSLLQQDYKGLMSIIVINDNSNDNTFQVAVSASQGHNNVHLINGTKTPSDWTGKIWALAQGIVLAKKNFRHAKYFLFTDSDILHHPENLTELTNKAVNESLALVSLMAKLRCTSVWETLLIPAFIFFFQKLYPFALVNNPKNPVAAAAGGCMLVNCQDLEKVGGLEAIKTAVIDDCALAILLKQFNPIWIGLTQSTKSLREYQSLFDISRMVSRTAFVQLKYSPLNLFGAIMGMLIIYIIPLISVLVGVLSKEISLCILGLVGWIVMFLAYIPTLTLYNRPIWEASLLPISALFYSAMTVISAWQYMFGKVPTWKGRPMMKAKNTMPFKNKPANSQKEILAIIKQSGTSFYWAIRFLPKKKRKAMFAIYAFCRKVDDIADGKDPSKRKLSKLKEWRTKIDKLYNHRPTDLITHALAGPITNYNLNKEDFIAIIDGMKTDSVKKLRIPNKAALTVYCDQVACAVGRLSNSVFGIKPEQGKKLAKFLGEALQLTNILRDIHEDGDRDRVYLPKDLLSLHGNDKIVINEILEHPGLTGACDDLAKLNREKYKQAEVLIKECDTKLIRPALIMMKIYYQLFVLLERRGWENYKVPVKVSKSFKFWIVARVLIFKK